MAEEGWRVNARGRRVPSRVTSNMRAFTGEKPEGGRDKAGRRYLRSDGGTGDRIPVTSTSNRKQRQRASAKNPGVGRRGGTRTSDVDRPSNVERRGKGPSPITTSRTRSKRAKLATLRRRTQGGEGLKEFKVGKSPVTKGKGGYAGYRHIKPGSNEPIRKVDPPQYESSRRRSGQGRTNMTSPNAQKTNQRTGRSPMRGEGRTTSANDTGARRTGGGRKGQISSKGGPQKSGYKPKINLKGKVKANTVLKGAVSLLSKRLNHAMTAADIWKLGKTDSALDKALKRIPDTSDRDAGRLLGNKIVSLATAAYNKVKGSKAKTDTPTPKKETKPKRQTKRLIKK